MFVYIRSAAFVIGVTQKLGLQQSKNVTAKFTETLPPPPSIIQYLLGIESIGNYILCTQGHSTLRLCTVHIENQLNIIVIISQIGF